MRGEEGRDDTFRSPPARPSTSRSEAPARPNEGGERRHRARLAVEPVARCLRARAASARPGGGRACRGRCTAHRGERRRTPCGTAAAARPRPAPDLARTPAPAQPLESPHAPQGDLGRDDPRPARAEVGEEQALASGRRAGVEHTPVGCGEPADELRSLVLSVDDALRRERGQPAVEERERAGDSGRLRPDAGGLESGRRVGHSRVNRKWTGGIDTAACSATRRKSSW